MSIRLKFRNLILKESWPERVIRRGRRKGGSQIMKLLIFSSVVLLPLFYVLQFCIRLSRQPALSSLNISSFSTSSF